MRGQIPHVVYHVAMMGPYRREIVWGQLGLLRSVGLTDVRMTHVGRDLDWVLAQGRAFGVGLEVVRSDRNTDHYETFAMLEIERLAKVERTERPILYLHTKGASSSSLHKQKWRRLMEEWVVRRWQENVAHLETHDAVGVDWYPCGDPHFSGTFWLARPDWIRKLPPFVEYHHRKSRVRYSCETWIGSVPGCRPKSLACQGQTMWLEQFDIMPLFPQPKYSSPEPVAGSMKPRLAVVTACTRPRNLPFLAPGIDELRQWFDVNWVVVVDRARVVGDVDFPPQVTSRLEVHSDGTSGTQAKNAGLSTVENCWVYVLDDDNVIHPTFPEAAAWAVRTYPQRRAFLFGQKTRDAHLRLAPGVVLLGAVDTAMFLVHTDVIENIRFRPARGTEADDFGFLSQVRAAHPAAFETVPAFCSYWNGLPRVPFAGSGPAPATQHEAELTELVELYRSMAPKRVLEIGSLYGGTLWHWLTAANPELVVSVDLVRKHGDPMYDYRLHGRALEYYRRMWDGWARPGCILLRIEGDSTDPGVVESVSAAVPANDLDWVFIDGGHSYETVKADFDHYRGLVRSGGVIAFHDINVAPGVERCWSEVANQFPHREIAAPGGYGIGVVFI